LHKDGTPEDDEARQMKGIEPARPRTIPFLLLVQEVIGLDISLPMFSKLLGKTMLRLHCACSNWSDVSDEIEAAKGSRIAHWINMKWKIPVTFIKNSIRLTLWCGNRSLGYCVLPVTSLLDVPCDRTGRSEIFAKIYASSTVSSAAAIASVNDEMIGRVRIVCRFDENGVVGISPKKKKSLSETASHFKNKNIEDTDEEFPDFAENYSHPMNHSIAIEERDRSFSSLQELKPPKSFPLSTAPKKIELPAQFTLKSISAIDLIPIHRLVKNSPQVRFICDRVSGFTDISLHR
jgi:hypothetical protein